MNYAVGSAPKVNQFLLGYADDNWLNGTQSGSFSFIDPEAASFGIGLTGTAIHEVGHHSSMSHPHDGYDPESDVHFGGSGEHYFAWLGDYSSTVMSYIRLDWDFGQFDQDNSARHHAAGFALSANRVAAEVEGTPGSGAVLEHADASLVSARAALAEHEYVASLRHAEDAYRALLAWADAHGVRVEVQQPAAWTLLPPSKLGLLIGKPHSPISGPVDLDPDETRRWMRY